MPLLQLQADAAPSDMPADLKAVSSAFHHDDAGPAGVVGRAARSGLEFVMHAVCRDVQDDVHDPLTPALTLAWLPTLPRHRKTTLLGRLDAATPSLVARAAAALGTWRAGGDPRLLRRRALDLLRNLDRAAVLAPAQAALALHPVLLAVRLAKLPLESAGAFDPHDVIRRHLRPLADHLAADGGPRAAETSPALNVLLCLGTELWRETTPLTAALRRPLEVATRHHWQRFQQAEDLQALDTAALDTAALDTAALLIAAENLHIDADLTAARWRLAALQEGDGGYPAACLPGVYPGPREAPSRALTTLFATRALLGQPRTRGAWMR